MLKKIFVRIELAAQKQEERWIFQREKRRQIYQNETLNTNRFTRAYTNIFCVCIFCF